MLAIPDAERKIKSSVAALSLQKNATDTKLEKTSLSAGVF